MNTNKIKNILGAMFQKTTIHFDPLTNQAGIVINSEFIAFDADEKAVVTNPWSDAVIEMPGFAIHTPPAKLKTGMLLMNSKGQVRGWITKTPKKDTKSVEYITAGGEIKRHVPKKQVGPLAILPVGELVVDTTVFQSLQSNAENSPMGMLPLLMLAGNEDEYGNKSNLRELLPLMLLQNQNGEGGLDMNNMLPLMLMGGDTSDMLPLLLMQNQGGGDNNMLQTLLMMKALGK